MEVTNAEFNEFLFPLKALRLSSFILPDGRPVTQVRQVSFYVAAVAFLVLQVLVVLQLVLSPLVITANVTATAVFLSSSLLTVSRHLFFLYKKEDIITLVRYIQSKC